MPRINSAANIFKMPNQVKVTGKVSGITNSFVNGIIPCIKPTEGEVDDALRVLGMDRDSICCSYCGDTCTEWDHLNPLVMNKRPTGYISEIHNLVPACGKCNQSKRNQPWRIWIVSSAPRSPKSKGVPDLDARIARLEEYERTFEPIKIDFEQLVGKELWQEHWANYEAIIMAMHDAVDTSDKIKATVAAKLQERSSR